MDNLKKVFGNKKVTANIKTKLVQEVFTNVAEKYDLMNDLMSFKTHRLWKKDLVEIMNIQKKDKIIDVGSGTGDLAQIILNQDLDNDLYCVDLNNEMLKYSKKNLNNLKIKFINANAESLPFSNNLFDKYVISFCLRNVTDIKKALNESFRVLKPGGSFYCLEFSTPESSLVNLLYGKYKTNIIPIIGKFVANNKEAYKYLDESIEKFPNQNELLNYINKIGFKNTKYWNIFNGVVSIHKGFKIWVKWKFFL